MFFAQRICFVLFFDQKDTSVLCFARKKYLKEGGNIFGNSIIVNCRLGPWLFIIA